MDKLFKTRYICDLCSISTLNLFFFKGIYIDQFPGQISEASKMYTGLDKDKKQFTLLPCWNILKEEDKWKAKRIEIAEMDKQAATNKKQKSTKVSRPRDEEGTSNQQGKDDVPQETQARKRADGIKKAKENLRRGGGEACLAALDTMWAKKEVSDKEKEKAK